jgi:hypothetical protein
MIGTIVYFIWIVVAFLTEYDSGLLLKYSITLNLDRLLAISERFKSRKM